MGDYVVDASEAVDPRREPDVSWEMYGVSNRAGVFRSTTQLGREFRTPQKRIRENWFFHNPTRANVGSLGLVPAVSEHAITSPEYQVWRIERDLLPGYVALLLATPLFRQLIQVHRVGAVKQRLFVDNLRQIPVPTIPEPRQTELALKRSEIMSRIARMAPDLAAAKERVEALITGRESLIGN